MKPEEVLSKFRRLMRTDRNEIDGIDDDKLWEMISDWAEAEWWRHGCWKFMGGR